jgi:hypothetical protein
MLMPLRSYWRVAQLDTLRLHLLPTSAPDQAVQLDFEFELSRPQDRIKGLGQPRLIML